MNDAPTKGFEKDVGTRTTARVIGHLNLKRVFAENPDSQLEFFANKSTRAEKIFIHWSYLTNIDKDSVEEYNLGMEFAKNYPHVEFNMFTPQKMKYAEKLFHHETGLTRYVYTVTGLVVCGQYRGCFPRFKRILRIKYQLLQFM